MPDRIYVNVNSDFDSTGYMMPRSITWKDGRTFRIESVKDFRPASAYRKGMQGDCYTVVIKGETRHLFFEKTGDLFASVLLGGLLRGDTLETATSLAVRFVGRCAGYTAALNTPVQEGVQFEPFLGELGLVQ